MQLEANLMFNLDMLIKASVTHGIIYLPKAFVPRNGFKCHICLHMAELQAFSLNFMKKPRKLQDKVFQMQFRCISKLRKAKLNYNHT